jgi:MFS family permease
MVWLKFLHIACMFGTVTLFVGGEVILAGVARSGDVRAFRRVGAVTKRTDGIAILLLLAGIGFGFAAAVTGHFDLTAGWLIAAYVLVGVVFALGFGYFTPRYERIMKAAEASPDDAPSEELARLLDPRKELLVMVLDLALWGSIVYVMVAKPFS